MLMDKENKITSKLVTKTFGKYLVFRWCIGIT